MDEADERDVGDFFEIPEKKYEYLDHPADVQLHAWGQTLEECFEQTAIAMFAYMTDIETVSIQTTWTIECEASDIESLLFNYLNEFLYYFSAENFLIARKVKILNITKDNVNDQNFDGDEIHYKLKAKGYGESFDLAKHPQGTEVKAITYSCLQILKQDNFCECYVIIDI
ncbi:unnamed protein product [Gordionus sp. m RMFG-2023]|uniref:protein archease-like n=1 Tax=Gordionus sp. m RMFG-2023 TaxID=3053472 RepID=UPI0030E4ACD6